MTRDAWLTRHPYLRPVAVVHAVVERAAADIPAPESPTPDWDGYASDFRAGVPLLESTKVAMDLLPPEDAVRSLIDVDRGPANQAPLEPAARSGG